jgi:hypothetical protein
MQPDKAQANGLRILLARSTSTQGPRPHPQPTRRSERCGSEPRRALSTDLPVSTPTSPRPPAQQQFVVRLHRQDSRSGHAQMRLRPVLLNTGSAARFAERITVATPQCYVGRCLDLPRTSSGRLAVASSSTSRLMRREHAPPSPKSQRGSLTDSEFCWRRLLGDKAAVYTLTDHKRLAGTEGSEVDRCMRASEGRRPSP